MGTRGYTILGWAVYQIGSRLLKKTAKDKIKGNGNRAKLGAAGAVALVLVGGVIAARAASSD